MSIKRYDPYSETSNDYFMMPDELGDYIEYSEHLEALAEKDKEIARLRDALEKILLMENELDEFNDRDMLHGIFQKIKETLKKDC